MDNKGEKIRILLADSDEEFCAQMAALCEASEDMELVGIAENGDKALAAVGELRPELLITELSLPGMDGVMLLETLHREGEDAGGVRDFGVQQHTGLRGVCPSGRGRIPAQADRGGQGLRAHPAVASREEAHGAGGKRGRA